jgi:hypothetical protein
MDEKLTIQLTMALARRSLGFFYRRDLIEWALQALDSGLDTRSLRILGGLGKIDEYEADMYLQRCLGELGMCEPDRESCLRTYIASIGRNAVARATTLQCACREIYDIYAALGYPSSLRAASCLDDAWYLADKGVYRFSDIEEQALKEMRKLATLDSPDIQKREIEGFS